MDAMKMAFMFFVVAIAAAFVYFLIAPTPAAAPAIPKDQMVKTNTQAKLDIGAICDGALAYMTFPSGAEADVFVQDCKEGKHPEVIEQWKVQMGITDDRAI